MCLLTRQPVLRGGRRSRRCCYREIQTILKAIKPSYVLISPPNSGFQSHNKDYSTQRINQSSQWTAAPSQSSKRPRVIATLASSGIRKREPHTATGHKVSDGQGSTLPEQTNLQDLSTTVRLLMRLVPHPVTIITAAENTPMSDPPLHARNHQRDHKSTPESSSKVSPVKFRGMTASSFNTVTLHPQPVVSFNVKRPSETLNAIQSSGLFFVHLLAPNPDTAQLAREFSRGNENVMHLLESREGLNFEFGYDQQPLSSDNTDIATSSSSPPPILRRSLTKQASKNNSSTTRTETESLAGTDFPFILECQLLPDHQIHIHDHSIVLGNVIRVIQGQQQSAYSLPQNHQASSALFKSENTRTEENENEEDPFCLMYADTHFWTVGRKISDS